MKTVSGLQQTLRGLVCGTSIFWCTIGCARSITWDTKNYTFYNSHTTPHTTFRVLYGYGVCSMTWSVWKSSLDATSIFIKHKLFCNTHNSCATLQLQALGAFVEVIRWDAFDKILLASACMRFVTCTHQLAAWLLSKQAAGCLDNRAAWIGVMMTKNSWLCHLQNWRQGFHTKFCAASI